MKSFRGRGKGCITVIIITLVVIIIVLSASQDALRDVLDLSHIFPFRQFFNISKRRTNSTNRYNTRRIVNSEVHIRSRTG